MADNDPSQPNSDARSPDQANDASQKSRDESLDAAKNPEAFFQRPAAEESSTPVGGPAQQSAEDDRFQSDHDDWMPHREDPSGPLMPQDDQERQTGEAQSAPRETGVGHSQPARHPANPLPPEPPQPAGQAHVPEPVQPAPQSSINVSGGPAQSPYVQDSQAAFFGIEPKPSAPKKASQSFFDLDRHETPAQPVLPTESTKPGELASQQEEPVREAAPSPLANQIAASQVEPQSVTEIGTASPEHNETEVSEPEEKREKTDAATVEADQPDTDRDEADTKDDHDDKFKRFEKLVTPETKDLLNLSLYHSREVVTNPREFFRASIKTTDVSEPAMYLAVVTIAGGLLAGVMNFNLLITIKFVVVNALFAWLSAYCLWKLYLMSGSDRSFAQNFRIVGFSQICLLIAGFQLGILSVLTAVASFGYGLYLQYLGMKELHDLPKNKLLVVLIAVSMFFALIRVRFHL